MMRSYEGFLQLNLLRPRARRGRARERRQSGSRPSTGSRTSRRATCSAPRSRRGPSSAGRSSRSSRAATLVPDEITIALIRERLGEPDARARLRARRLPAQRWPRPRRSTSMLAEIGRRLDAVLFFELPDERRDRADAPARRARRAAPTTRPRRSRGGSRIYHARDRAGRRALPRDRASSCRSTPSARSTRSTPRSRTRSSRARGAARDHPQVRAGDRADGARRRASSPRRSRSSRSALEPGITMVELDRGRRRVHPLAAAASRPPRATRAIPAAMCISPNDDGRARHPGRLRGARRATSSPSTSASRRTAWSPTRPPRSPSARSRPRRSGCSTSARPRSRPGSRRRSSARSRRHLARGADGRRGRRLLGRPQPRRPRRRPPYHEDPQIPNFVSRVPRPGAARGHDARDRADDHRRRRPRCTSTTTSGRSRPSTARWRRISSTRSRSPREGPRVLTRAASGPGTMSAPRRKPCSVCLCVTNCATEQTEGGIGEQGREDRGRRRGHRGPAEHDVPREARRGPRRPRDDLREDAQALHPHPPRRQGQGGALALRPDPRPDHLPPPHRNR